MIQQIKMFIILFININKNYFFEKYNFITIKESNKKLFYRIWYIFSNHILVFIFFIVLNTLISSNTIKSLIVLLILITLFLGIDSKDWRLFYRLDFVSEIPETRVRFLIVLFGNVFLKLFIENNIIILFLFLVYYLRISLFYLPFLIFMFVLLHATVTSIYFIIQNSSFNIKKLFSFFNYLLSFLTTALFAYFFIDFIIKVFSSFIKTLDNRNVFNEFINQGNTMINNISEWIQNYSIYLLIIYFFSIFIISIFTHKTLKYIESTSYLDYEDGKYVVSNFWILKVVRRIINLIFAKNEVMKNLVNKELTLFTNIYKFNFKDYFFVFVADRSVAFLITFFLIIYKYEYSGSYILMIVLVPIIILMDINSSVGVKLIANLSFVTDFNTLQILNMSGFDIKKIINSKLYFYYIIKAFSFFILFLLYNIMYLLLDTPLIILLVSNLIILCLLAFFPKLYFTNNLIYSRMDYRDYEKYLEESKILDVGVSEFLPLNLIFRFWTTLMILSLLFSTIFNLISFNVIVIIIFFIQAISSVVVYFILTRIQNNIEGFIERGDYSANFAKIFQK